MHWCRGTGLPRDSGIAYYRRGGSSTLESQLLKINLKGVYWDVGEAEATSRTLGRPGEVRERGEITGKATRDARDLGYTLEDIVAVVQALESRDFVKSETAHSPPRSKVWHDTYRIPYDGLFLYLKFAGETLIDVVLTSFKEV
jgi:motility quorum-sensing regulator/GCU-specific mRNA interferase toxin